MSNEPVSKQNTQFAWRQVERAEPPKRAVGERLSDFLEIYGPYDEATAQQQASRCIQCPNPTCVEDCPLESQIPQWLALTAEGQYRDAAELMLASGMPEIHARVCIGERTCEAACVLSAKSEPVPISSIGRFLLDYAWSHGLMEPQLASPTGRRVAVIGSGLCGLTGADELSRMGYAVTVIDSHAKPGGRLVNGLPGFKVDKALVERRVELLKRRGVQFRMSTAYGQDATLQSLREEFDAVFFGLGRAEANPLEIPGAHLKGVHQAYPFVLQHTSDVKLDVPPVEVRDKRVAVLGGGDTAMDSLRIAIRDGAREAVCIYRRDAANMPASPKEYGNAVEEGAQFLFLSLPIAILGNAAGEVTRVRCVETQLTDPEGSGSPGVQPVPGKEFDVTADVVLVAHGFAPPKLPRCEDFANLAVDDRGCLVVDDNQMTNLPGVFAGGSIVHGPIPLVDAVRDARRAAAAIARYVSAKAKPPSA